ncbi:receptor-type tyrosine-protein phosphatase eta [Coregonus clupeaformis]|uniref:receptor-type tyrosine-protein phosphatase eta n=1 Tax=Coregonus clupeaformis TaxID=59861 RepID=UPI001E1C31FB|nr:receptor-type tyrosine-protein phosphatase eta [Coregonus clupeaformis]
MDRIQHLILWAVLVECCVAERQYFLHSNSSTWEQARLHCQACYKEMVSLTPDNIQQLAQNLNSSYWIGLRKTLNNGSFPWSSWSNGDPVTFQNWYPGRPILSKPKDPVNNIFNYNNYSIPPNDCGCCCPSQSNPASVPLTSTTDYSFTENENMTALSTMTPAVTTMTSVMTSGPTFFTGVTGGTNGTNGTNETATDVYIEEPCIALLSFGLWFDKICSELLPYICYEDRFYGNANITNKTLHNATLSWTRGPGDISGYRVEVKSTDYNLTLNHSSLNRTYDLSNLTAGTQYRVQVFPIKCWRDLNPQNVSFYTKPDVIKYINITNVSETNIFLSWPAPEGNRGFYSIQVRDQPNLNMITRTESAEVKGLIPGGLYMFEVNANVEDKSIEGDQTNITSYSNSVDFQWEQPAGNTSGYRVEVWVEENNKMRSNITQSYTNYTAEKLPSGAKIWLRVVALVPDGSVEGEPSAAMGLTTPDKVTNLLLVPTADTINVTWTLPQGNFETFSVQLKLNFSNKEVENSITNASHISFPSLMAGVAYNVTVTTLNGDLKSEPESVTNFTLPLPPQSPKINFFNQSHVNLTWQAPMEYQGVQITYLVKYSAEFWNRTRIHKTTNTSYMFHNLTAGTNYIFEIRVKAGTQESVPIETSQTTNATVRVQTMTMECASSKPSFCEDIGARTEVLNQLKKRFSKTFSRDQGDSVVDNVFWELAWREA